MTEALRKLNCDPVFLSAIGQDLFGRELLRQFQLMKIDHSRILSCESASSAIYSAMLNNKGECLFGLGDMTVHDEISAEYIHHHANIIESAPIVVLDANIPAETIFTVLDICKSSGTPVWFEPTEIRKARKICKVPKECLQAVSYISPNIHELNSILDEATKHGLPQSINKNLKFLKDPTHFTNPDEINAITECFQVLPKLEMLLLTKGSDGIMVIFKNACGHLESFLHPAPEIDPLIIVSVSGAGDCLNAGVITGILRGLPWKLCAQLGTQCASQSLQSIANVPYEFQFPDANPDLAC